MLIIRIPVRAEYLMFGSGIRITASYVIRHSALSDTYVATSFSSVGDP